MISKNASFIAHICASVVRLLVSTLRFQIEDHAGILGTSEPRAIWVFWHNRMLVVPHLLKRYLPLRKGAALTSASNDGDVVAGLLQRFGIKPVRGSSSRRGATALRELNRLIRNGFDVAITPDGPGGPRYSFHPGTVTLAQMTGAKVLSIRVQYSRFWQLKTWDGFQIPKPFTTVAITLLAFESISPTFNNGAFEQERARLEAILTDDDFCEAEPRYACVSGDTKLT